MADLSSLFQQYKINPISTTQPQKRPMQPMSPAQAQGRFSPMAPMPQNQMPSPAGGSPMMQYIQQGQAPNSQPSFNLPGVPAQPAGPQTPPTLSSDQLNQIAQQLQAQGLLGGQQQSVNPNGMSFAAAQGGLMGNSGVNPGPNFAMGGMYAPGGLGGLPQQPHPLMGAVPQGGMAPHQMGGLPPMAQGGYAYGGYASGGIDRTPLGSANHQMPKHIKSIPTSHSGGIGLAQGPGTGTSDSIRAPKLSNGEFVHTAKAVQGAGRLATGHNNTQAGARLMYGLMRGLENIASH